MYLPKDKTVNNLKMLLYELGAKLCSLLGKGENMV